MQMLDTECAKAAMGASFAIVTGGALTLFIAAPPNGTSVWVRVVDEVSDAVFEQEITADRPASTQFPSPWLYMNNSAIAAAVAYDCAGVYVETDFQGGGRIRPRQRMRPPLSMAGHRPLGWRKLAPAWRAPSGFAAISHRRTRSGPPSGVSRGPRAFGSGSPSSTAS